MNRYGCALVTGATSGLGAAFARRLPASTALLLTGRNAEALSDMALELGTPARRVETVVADLSTEAGREQVIARADALEIDLLINNAGAGDYSRFLDTPAEKVEAALCVNAIAPVVLARRLLPGMLERAAQGQGQRLGQSQGRAGLINVSSSFAFVPAPRLAVYGGTKAMVLSWSEAIAAELSGCPVDVLTLCPGPTRTAFGERAGYSGGALPGALSPDRVADQALRALGRERTLLTGYSGPVAFGAAARLRTAIGDLGERVLRLSGSGR